MTVIAWDGKILAADRLLCVGHMKNTGTKIIRHENYMLGIYGNMSMGIALINWFKDGCVFDNFPVASNNDPEYDAGMVVIKPDGSVWEYVNSPHPLLLEDSFAAFGSGAEGAMVAMECGCDAKEAVEIVSKYNITCGNGVDVLAL